MNILKLGIAQLSPTAGDLGKNLERLFLALKELQNSDLILLSPLPLSGYPLNGLGQRREFWEEVERFCKEFLSFSKEIKPPILFSNLNRSGFALSLVKKGGVLIQTSPSLGLSSLNFNLNSWKIVASYSQKPLDVNTDFSHLKIILSLRPYYFGGEGELKEEIGKLSRKSQSFVVFLRNAYAQDEFIYPGKSLIFSPKGDLIYQAQAFKEEALTLTIPQEASQNFKTFQSKDDTFGELYQALTFALKEYVEKNGFPGVLFGLSGGIDSSLVACLAVSALGKEKVHPVFLPSDFTSQASREDARTLAQNLGLCLKELPIQELFSTYRNYFRTILGIEDFTVADENLQARIRANLLFYLANRQNLLVLCTTNKSESATGYGTLYGDLAGGYAPLKDVYKTWVYELARYCNEQSVLIPERVFTKPPSAELREGQRDEDELLPYPYLDAILQDYLEKGLTPKELVAKGYPEEYVKKTLNLLVKSEFKRRQAPLGPKICRTTLGLDYILPIVHKFPL